MLDLQNMADRQLLELLQSLTDRDGVLERTELAQQAQNELMKRPNCFYIRLDHLDADFEKAIAILGLENFETSQNL